MGSAALRLEAEATPGLAEVLAEIRGLRNDVRAFTGMARGRRR